MFIILPCCVVTVTHVPPECLGWQGSYHSDVNISLCSFTCCFKSLYKFVSFVQCCQMFWLLEKWPWVITNGSCLGLNWIPILILWMSEVRFPLRAAQEFAHLPLKFSKGSRKLSRCRRCFLRLLSVEQKQERAATLAGWAFHRSLSLEWIEMWLESPIPHWISSCRDPQTSPSDWLFSRTVHADVFSIGRTGPLPPVLHVCMFGCVCTCVHVKCVWPWGSGSVNFGIVVSPLPLKCISIIKQNHPCTSVLL